MIFINHRSTLAENFKNGLNQSTISAKQTSSTQSAWLMFEVVISRLQCDVMWLCSFVFLLRFLCFYLHFFLFSVFACSTCIITVLVIHLLLSTTTTTTKNLLFLFIPNSYSLEISTLKRLFHVTGSVSLSKQMCLFLHDVTNTVFSYFTKKHSRTHSICKPGRKSQCSFKGKVSDRFIGGPGCEPKGS